MKTVHCERCRDKCFLIECACGCGQIIQARERHHGRRHSYQNHHFTKMERHPNWHGGRKMHSGYWQILLPYHHRADTKGYVYEHVVIAERALGRLIYRNEHVHHINGIRTDNRLHNLLVISASKHTSITWTGLKHSEESKMKISVKRKGTVASLSTRAKMSVSQRLRRMKQASGLI